MTPWGAGSTIFSLTSPPRQARLRAALGWLAPSGVAGAAGALAAGLVDGSATSTISAGLATAGFLALLAVSVLAIGSAALRGIVVAWQPAQLASALIDADGAAPRLA